MALRRWSRRWAGGVLSDAMRDLNARHPWSHNDHFHSWVLAGLPERRRTALDVGCGRGGLLVTLAPYVEAVHGVDRDPTMRQAAAARCAGLPNVLVDDAVWSELPGPFDLVTMVAVLHHLDEATALHDVRRLLAPGGRFLAVGLAPPRSARDHAWDLASVVTNPLIGYVKHPWRARADLLPPVPIRDPTLSFDELHDLVDEAMPGAAMRHHLGFRHTIAWTAPA